LSVGAAAGGGGSSYVGIVGVDFSGSSVGRLILCPPAKHFVGVRGSLQKNRVAQRIVGSGRRRQSQIGGKNDGFGVETNDGSKAWLHRGAGLPVNPNTPGFRFEMPQALLDGQR